MKRCITAVGVTNVLILLAIAARAAASEPPRRAGDAPWATELKALQAERIKELNHVVAQRMSLFLEGRCLFIDISLAQNELLAAELDSTDDLNERVKLLKQQLELADRLFAYAERRYQAGEVSWLDVGQATSLRLNVRIKLLREAKDAHATELKALQAERISALEKVVTIAMDQYGAGVIELASTVSALNELLVAQLDSTAAPDGKAALLTKQLRLADELLAVVKRRYEAGSVGGVDVSHAKSLSLNVKIKLLRAAKPTPAGDIKALQAERTKELNHVVAQKTIDYRQGMVSLNRVVAAQNQLIEAELDSTDDPEQRVKLLREQLELTGQLLKYAQSMFENGRALFVDISAVKALRLDVIGKLLREYISQGAATTAREDLQRLAASVLPKPEPSLTAPQPPKPPAAPRPPPKPAAPKPY